MTTPSEPDRYTRFQGMDCEGRAGQILARVDHYVTDPPHASSWIGYFRSRLQLRRELNQDNLYFVGSQVNSIRALFEEYGDDAAIALLEKVEDACC